MTEKMTGNQQPELVHFELNNWSRGVDYPDDEPFRTWMGNDLNLKFYNEEWLKENQLCVVAEIIDMSVTFCITATKEWVEKNCPTLLTKYQDFIRQPDEDGTYYGKFDTLFTEWEPENFGLTWRKDPLDDEYRDFSDDEDEDDSRDEE